MNSRHPHKITSCLLLAFLAGSGLVRGQSAFPMSFDSEPLTNAMSITTAGAVSSTTARSYSRGSTYEVNPAMSNVDVLDVTATADDTVVVIKMLVVSTQRDTANAGSMKQVVVRAHWDADALAGSGQWSGIRNQGVFFYNVNGEIGISVNVAGSGPLEISVSPAPGHQLVTVDLEAIANEDVTFSEFTDPT